jgi:hypothetical protein
MKGVIEHYQATKAVAEEEEGKAGLLVPDDRQESVQVIP